MEQQAAIRLVHYYDPGSRRIACGIRGFDQRSTKHVRAVTCLACLSALKARATPGAEVVAAVHE